MVVQYIDSGVQAERLRFWDPSQIWRSQNQQKLNCSPETTCKSLCELFQVLPLQLQNSNVPLVQYSAR